MNLIQELTEHLIPILKEQGLELYDMAFVKENGMRILRIMIFTKEGGIDLDMCSEVSEIVSKKLDAIDADESEYYLEVCSAGAERELRTPEEIQQAVGSHVFVKLKNPVAGLSEVTGELLLWEDNAIEIAYRVKTAKKQLRLSLDQIALIRLAVRL